MKRFSKVLMGLLLILSGMSVQAQDRELVKIANLKTDHIMTEGFALSEDGDINIQAMLLTPEYERGSFTYSNVWILNALSREVVWEAMPDNYDRKTRYLSELNGEIFLPKGTYEVYYSTYPGSYSWMWSESDSKSKYDFDNPVEAVKDAFEYLFRDDNDRYDFDRDMRTYSRDLFLTIKGNGTPLNQVVIDEIRKLYRQDAIIDATGLDDYQYVKKNFKLNRDTDIEIYALGEMNRDEQFDYGWIINTENSRKIWEFNYRNSEPGGGAEKNRRVKTLINLPAGTYSAFYVTDDSHSFRRWNSMPPYDPSFWGMVVKPANPSDGEAVELVDIDQMMEKQLVVNLTRVRDESNLIQGFELKKPANIRIIAIGEGSGGDMYDYGWIEDARTREVIWNMDYRITTNAGGAQKNRLADEVIQLPAGKYYAQFVTDGSHSYMDWNSTPPYDQDGWGIRVLLVDMNADSTTVTLFDELEEEDIIAQLVRMGDDENRTRIFKIEKTGYYRVYGIGEGFRGDMYDYGLIESENGSIIYEMTYRKSSHAGGADKNRMVNDVIYLESGTYLLRYVSDDSHSYRDWNDDPPRDRQHWGITIYKSNGSSTGR